MLPRDPIPLYYHVETVLRKRIRSGELTAGTALPREDVLAKEYGVSRVTVRQALSDLEREGLIVRKRGKGTFISENRLNFDPPKLSGFLEDLISMGIKTESKLLDFSTVSGPTDITDRLALPKQAEVLRIERLRLVKDRPFSHILEYLPAAIGKKLSADDLLVVPLLTILEDKLHLPIAEAEQSIEADIADYRVASLLNIRAGEPLLKIERTVFDSRHAPIEHVSVLYRADQYRYTVHLVRKRSSKTVERPSETARWTASSR